MIDATGTTAVLRAAQPPPPGGDPAVGASFAPDVGDAVGSRLPTGEGCSVATAVPSGVDVSAGVADGSTGGGIVPAAVGCAVATAAAVAVGVTVTTPGGIGVDVEDIVDVAVVEARHVFLRGHMRRVCELSVAIGEELGVTDTELRAASYAALLHDLGKLGMPPAILHKPGRLAAAS